MSVMEQAPTDEGEIVGSVACTPSLSDSSHIVTYLRVRTWASAREPPPTHTHPSCFPVCENLPCVSQCLPCLPPLMVDPDKTSVLVQPEPEWDIRISGQNDRQVKRQDETLAEVTD